MTPHTIDPTTGSCTFCGATKVELESGVAPPDCLGPAGQQLRREALAEKKPE